MPDVVLKVSEERIELVTAGSALTALLLAQAEAAADRAEGFAATLASSQDRLLTAAWLATVFRETVEDGVRIAGLVVEQNNLAAGLADTIRSAAAQLNLARETVEDGLRIRYGDRIAVLDVYGLDVRLAQSTIDAAGEAMAGVGGVSAIAYEETVDGFQRIRVMQSGGAVTTLADGKPWNDRSPEIRGGGLFFRSDRSAQEAVKYRPYVSKLLGSTTVRLGPTMDVLVGIVMGQSLGYGGVGGGVVWTADPFQLGGALMPVGGIHLTPAPPGQYTSQAYAALVVDPASFADFVPIAEVPQNGTPTGTIGAALARRLATTHGLPSIQFNVAIPGAGYDLIRPGTAPFENAMLALASLFRQLRRLGLRARPYYRFQHGEANAGDQPGIYFQRIQEFHGALIERTRAILGDPAYPVHMFFAPPPSPATSRVPIDMWRYSLVEPTAHLLGTINGNWFQDAQHPTNEGDAIIGADIDYPAVKAVLIDGVPWVPLQPVDGSLVRNGNKLTFQVQVPAGNAVYRADAVSPALPDWGLEVFRLDNSPVGVTGVAIGATANARATVTMNLAGDPGAGCFVRASWSRHGDYGAAGDMPHNNISTDVALVSLVDGRNIYPRLVPFELQAA